jgi:hypothetical protein
MTKAFPITNDELERGVHAASTSFGTFTVKRSQSIRHSPFVIFWSLFRN